MTIGVQETEQCPRCGRECRYLFSFDHGAWLCVTCVDDDVTALRESGRFGRRVRRQGGAECPMATPPAKGVTYGWCSGCERVVKSKNGAQVRPCPLQEGVKR